LIRLNTLFVFLKPDSQNTGEQSRFLLAGHRLLHYRLSGKEVTPPLASMRDAFREPRSFPDESNATCSCRISQGQEIRFAWNFKTSAQ
jgi:hypothetical protein